MKYSFTCFKGSIMNVVHFLSKDQHYLLPPLSPLGLTIIWKTQIRLRKKQKRSVESVIYYFEFKESNWNNWIGSIRQSKRQRSSSFVIPHETITLLSTTITITRTIPILLATTTTITTTIMEFFRWFQCSVITSWMWVTESQRIESIESSIALINRTKMHCLTTAEYVFKLSTIHPWFLPANQSTCI